MRSASLLFTWHICQVVQRSHLANPHAPMRLLLQIKSKWCLRSVKNDEESAVRYHAAATGASHGADECRVSWVVGREFGFQAIHTVSQPTSRSGS